MKKILFATAAFLALSPMAHAQDKSGSTYTPQPVTTAPAERPVYSNTTSSSTSYTNNDTSADLTGPYIGAYGGYGWTNADTAIGDANVDGWDYGALVGYKLGTLFNNSMGINAAIEAYIGDSNADDTVAGVDFDKNMEWGINLRPGLSFLSMGGAINPYGIIGYRNTEFEAAGSEDDYNGFDLGIGTELISWGNVGLRADYTHTWYEEKNGIDPDENDLRMGLTYHFM